MIFFSKYYIKESIFLSVLFLATLVLRVLYILIFYDPDFLVKGDNLQYYTFAREILKQGLAVPDVNINKEIAGNWSMLGPGFPLIVSFCLTIFGDSFFPVFFLNALFTSLVVIVLYYLIKEVTLVKAAHLIIILWSMLNINYFRYTTFLFKESLVFLLLPMTILFLVREAKNLEKISWNIFFSAVSYGYLIHTDERYFFYLPFMIGYFLLYYKKSPGLFAKKQLVFIATVLCLMSPWMIRNYNVYEQVVILTERTTRITSKLWGNDLTREYNSLKVMASDYSSIIKKIKDNNASTSDTVFVTQNVRDGLNEFEKKPYKFGPTEKYIRAVLNFWRPAYFRLSYINDGFSKQQWSQFHNISSLIFYGLFLPFYFAGFLYFIRKKDFNLIFVSSIPLIQMLIHVMLIHVLERYRNPIDSFVVISAICYLYCMKGNFRTKLNDSLPDGKT